MTFIQPFVHDSLNTIGEDETLPQGFIENTRTKVFMISASSKVEVIHEKKY